MANELKHGSVGTELTQAEWEGIGTHVLESQAAGDIIYASSTAQLRRLGIGSNNDILHIASGIPAWQSALTTDGTDVFVADGAGAVFGHSTKLTHGSGTGNGNSPEVQVTGVGAADAAIAIARFSADVNSAKLVALKSRAAVGSFSAVDDDDKILDIIANIDDGTDYNSTAASIRFAVDGTPGTGDAPGRVMILTSADGAESPTERVRVDSSGRVLINETANDNMTVGLTINQGANDPASEILAFKSSDVTHGMTSRAETDTYSWMQKYGATTGGVAWYGLSEDEVAVRIVGYHTNDNTTKSSAGRAPIELLASKKSGASTGALGANANVFAIRSDSVNTVWIVDEDGDTWQAGGITANGLASVAAGSGVVIGDTALDTIGTFTPTLQVLGDDASESSMAIIRYGNSSAAPHIRIGKTRHGTVGSVGAIVADNDGLGEFIWYGDDGTNLDHAAAKIAVEVDGTPGLNDMPGRMIFATTADGGIVASERMRIDSSGRVFIGGTANANASEGSLTLNQGADIDDAILSFKSPDLAHGATSFGDTDTYGLFMKDSGDDGGMRIRGISEATIGLRISAVVGTNDTTKTTSGRGGVDIETRKIAGIGSGSNDADANIMVIRSLDSTRFIFDNEGSAHGDVEWITFDDQDDLAMLRDFESMMIPARFGESLTYHRSDFERHGIIGKGSWREEDGRTRAMINTTRLLQLHHGAIQQVYDNLAARIDLLTQALTGAGIPLPEAT